MPVAVMQPHHEIWTQLVWNRIIFCIKVISTLHRVISIVTISINL